MEWFSTTLTWYLMTTVATIAIAPLALWLCRGVTDRGASIARPIAALAMIWPVWFLAGIGSGIVPFGTASLWVSLIVVGAASWILGWRAGVIDRTAIRHLIIAEAAFLVFFALFIWFHGYGPQINEQEKPGDMMMLASSMRSTEMPPADAWMAGESINYYYLGYVIWAAFAKMIDAAPWEAFNLALASVFGMTCVAASGLAANIVGRWASERIARIAGAVGVLFVVFIGNPWGSFTALGNWSTQWTSFFFGGIGWESTRFFKDTADSSNIAEFPAFSFVLGDLHPHLLALPYALVALGIAWALAQGITSTSIPNLGRVALAGAIVGSLYAMNSWDMPPYLVVTLVGLLVGAAALAWRDRLIVIVTLGLGAVIAWLPFYANFEAPTKQGQTGFASTMQDIPVVGGVFASIVSYQGERTSAGEFLGVFGFVWVIALLLIGIEFLNRRHAEVDPLNQKFAIGAIVILVLGSILIPVPVLALAGIPIVLIVMLIQRDPRLTLANVSLGLFAIGFAIAIVPEFFYLSDIFSSRMNTIFKLYYQVWLLAGIAAAIAVISIWQSLRPLITIRIATIIVTAGTAVILALGLVYPVVGAKQWLDWRNPTREWVGINGLEYLNQPTQPWNSPGEYNALSWLWDNAQTDDVVLSQGGCEWGSDLGRTPSATGIPAILGWDGHERQWHLADPEINGELVQRTTDIRSLYTQPTPELLDEYGITLIYIGHVETNGSSYANAKDGSSCAPGPFPGASDPNYPGAGWTEVYNADGVRIYRKDGS